jgi:adenylate cyclase class 2
VAQHFSRAHAAPVETEIKLAFPSAAAARRALRQAGFALHTRRGLETNSLYDLSDSSLRTRGLAVRHRTWHGKNIITYKGPAQLMPGASGRLHKQRVELETTVGDAAPILATWEAAGLHPTFCYEKYRSIYTRGKERGKVMLDETPLGVYLELEGTGSWIDRTASLLGFVPSQYIQQSYVALHAEACARAGVPFCDLMFTPQK